MKFDPNKTHRVEKGPRLCAVGFVSNGGRYAGTIRFEGEHGYTKVDAGSARGFRGRGTIECSHGTRTPGTFLGATAGPLSFFAADPQDFPGPFFTAILQEQQGPVSITRGAGRRAPAPPSPTTQGSRLRT